MPATRNQSQRLFIVSPRAIASGAPLQDSMAGRSRYPSSDMARAVYIAGVGLTKVDLTGRVFGSVFDLFAEAYELALADSRVRAFDAVQIGIMDSEEFENRANIAAKVADRLGLRGIPAVRTETASSTGAAAFHEAYYKVASGECESVLVLAGERMKNVTTDVATAIMSKTVDPVERRFGFTMPGLIALVTQALVPRAGIVAPKDVPEILARLMYRAHALGAENPLAAFFGRREALASYFDATRNLPVATPLMRKDCSPICDGAAAADPDRAPRRGARGRARLGHRDAPRSSIGWCCTTSRPRAPPPASRTGARASASPRELERARGRSATMPSTACCRSTSSDLGAGRPEDEAVDALIGDPKEPPGDPLVHPVTGVRADAFPTNLSGGLKARGHPVGGTGLFQIVRELPPAHRALPEPARPGAGRQARHRPLDRRARQQQLRDHPRAQRLDAASASRCPSRGCTSSRAGRRRRRAGRRARTARARWSRPRPPST